MLYLDTRKAFSYGGSGDYHIFIFIGGRGRGKTYSSKKLVLKNFFYKNEKFIWLRATEKMCDTLKENNGRSFVDDIIYNKQFKFDFDFRILGDNTIEICKHPQEDKHKQEWNYTGKLMALSTFYKLKGNSFADIKTIVFDEFIAENDEMIRGDRALQFVNTIETIGRLRKDYRIILLANALNMGDPILNLFFTNIKKHGYYFNKEKGAVLYYMEDSKEFSEKRFESISGKILKGTSYEDVIAKNEFLTYDSLYFEKRPTGAIFFCTLENGAYKVNVHIKDYVYVSMFNNCDSNKLYARKIEDKSEFATLIPNRLLDRFRVLYSRNKIKFSNETARTIFVGFIK